MNILRTAEEKIAFKQQLKASCAFVLNERIKHSSEAIEQAQDSANSETKSSMGDKYEISRAMGQLDADMNAKQLKEAQNELKSLELLKTDVIYSNVTAGSVVMFEKLILFIASGVGTLKIENKEIITLSSRSPLFLQLKQKVVGDKFLFQNKERSIEQIF